MPAKRKPDKQTDIASRDEVLRILTAQARDGNVSATIALARELRAQPSGDDFDFEAELDRLIDDAD